MRRIIATILFVLTVLNFLSAAFWGFSTVEEYFHLSNDGFKHSGVDYLGVYMGAGGTLFHTFVGYLLCIIHVCVERRRPMRYISVILGMIFWIVLGVGTFLYF